MKRLPRDIVRDQKQIWTFPFNAAHGRHWKPILGFAVTAAALVALDPHDTPYFRKTKSFARFDKAFSSFNRGLAEVLFPAAFYAAGLARRDSYAQISGIFGVEALTDAEAVAEVVKNVTRRVRPIEIPSNGDFSHTWFNARRGLLVNRGSFPSGHTTGAFAVAEVFAERYGHHRWAPWAAYGLASIVGFSRVSNQNHFPSDVFAAAALGYSISHFVVLRPK